MSYNDSLTFCVAVNCEITFSREELLEQSGQDLFGDYYNDIVVALESLGLCFVDAEIL
jgi:hypothetical protein